MTFRKFRSLSSIRRRNAHASRLQARGDFGRALHLFKKNYEECLRQFGPTHPVTLNVKNSLAIAFRSAGLLSDALILFKENYAQRLQEEGSSSQDTLIARGNLARTYIDLSLFEQAIILLKKNLDSYLQAEGAHGTNTLLTQNSLAIAYREEGNMAEAISLFESLLSSRLSLVGPNSLETLATRNDLALAYQRAQQYDNAIPLLRQNLFSYKRILGPNDPQTVSALNNLVSVCESAPNTSGSDFGSTSSNDDKEPIVSFQNAGNEALDTVKEYLDVCLDNDHATHDKLDMLLARSDPSTAVGAWTGRVVFGGRPDVAVGFRERVEQERLRGLVIDGSQSCSVLVGMAGCGKSQLASALAQECEEAGWDVVAWVNAETKDSVRSDLVELARRLGVDMGDKPTQDQAVRRCLDHLQSAEASDRLVVFDNVEDFDDLTGVVPRGVGLRVVATTRSGRGWRAQRWENVAVGVFPREESIAYLLGAAGSQDKEAADAVAGRLGDLPLALAQAAATVFNEGWTLRRYLERLDRYSSRQVIRPVPGDSYTHDVSSALRMAVNSALDRIEDGLCEVARLQVGALAVLAESGVPTRWIDPRANEEQANKDTNADETNKGADARDAAAEDALLALTALLDASVLQQTADGSVTMLLRLQGQVLRENWNQGERAEAFDAAADLLDRVHIDSLPRKNTEGRRREARDLINQLRAIAAQDYSRPLFERERVVAGLPHVLLHARDLGLPNEALALRGAVSAVEEVLGAEHPGTLASRSGLASTYRAAGRLGEAIPLYEQVVADSVRILGDDHPSTLTSRNNLAGAYESAGRLGEAIPLYEQVVADRVRVLGPDHPSTLTSRNNLAYAYEKAGSVNEAIASYEGVFADSVRVLGPDHPHTLTSRNNLAGAFQAAGRLDEAIALYEEVADDSARVLGPDHPHTLTSRGNLAGAYESAGRLGEAIPLYEQVLVDSVRVLGADHPYTLTSRGNLAGAYESAGRLGEAIPLYEQTLADRVRILGADHPHTLASRGNLASAYESAGRLSEAIALYEGVLADSVRILGADHPDALAFRGNLAAAYQAAGHLGEAISLYEEVLADTRRVLGDDHPQTLTSRNNLARAYESAGRHHEAITLFKDTLEVCEEVLSPNHPLTIQVRRNLKALERELDQFPSSSPESSEE